MRTGMLHLLHHTVVHHHGVLAHLHEHIHTVAVDAPGIAMLLALVAIARGH